MKNRELVEYDGNYYDWDVIVSYMDDEIRENVHVQLAPCTVEEFLQEYIKKDIDFIDFINSLCPLII